ncbi:hypothetical protein TYRP_003024 [Tyrophagus putrescentiae]|nr:hypothetical protein TYRP_003024 [Tyrophagus putrescentiae]
MTFKSHFYFCLLLSIEMYLLYTALFDWLFNSDSVFTSVLINLPVLLLWFLLSLGLFCFVLFSNCLVLPPQPQLPKLRTNFTDLAV